MTKKTPLSWGGKAAFHFVGTTVVLEIRKFDSISYDFFASVFFAFVGFASVSHSSPQHPSPHSSPFDFISFFVSVLTVDFPSLASNPASLTALINDADVVVLASVTVACFFLRSIFASFTPLTPFNAFSTVPAQDPHVIPETFKVTVFVLSDANNVREKTRVKKKIICFMVTPCLLVMIK